MRVSVAVVRANVMRLLGDRTALFFLLAFPLLLIVVVNATAPSPGSARPIGVVVAGNAVDAEPLWRSLESSATLLPKTYPDEATLTAAIRRGTVAAGLVIAPTEAARSGTARVTARLLSDPSRPPSMTLRSAVEVALRTSGSSASSAPLAAPVVERVSVAADAPPILTGASFVAPAYLLLFVFINTLVAAWGLPADRASGLTSRVVATPAPARGRLLGEVGYRFAVALLQAAVVLVFGAVALDLHWGDPLAVASIVVLFAWVSTAAAVTLGSLARTADQVSAIAPPLGIALGMLGGCMWPLESAAPALRTIAQALPHAWAMAAFRQVTAAGAGLAGVAGELAVLAGFALLLTAAAWTAFRWRSARSHPA